jgi:hypothetical protein
MAGEQHKDELTEEQLDGVTGGSSASAPRPRARKPGSDEAVPAPQEGPAEDGFERPRDAQDLIKPF